MANMSLAVLAGALVLAGCTSKAIRQDFPPVPLPVVQPGDAWRYQVTDGFTRQPRGTLRWEVSEVSPTAVRVSSQEDGRAPAAPRLFTREWNSETGRTPVGLPLEPFTSGIASGQPVRYAPSYPAFRFPLEAGKRWNERIEATDPDTGKRVAMRVHARVVGSEQIRVPAGEFETVKVRREIYYEDGEWWRSPVAALELDWYAPRINQVARRRMSSQFWEYSSGSHDNGAVLRDGDSLIYELESYTRAGSSPAR